MTHKNGRRFLFRVERSFSFSPLNKTQQLQQQQQQHRHQLQQPIPLPTTPGLVGIPLEHVVCVDRFIGLVEQRLMTDPIMHTSVTGLSRF